MRKKFPTIWQAEAFCRRTLGKLYIFRNAYMTSLDRFVTDNPDEIKSTEECVQVFEDGNRLKEHGTVQ